MFKRWTYRGMIDGDIDLTPEQRREAERRMSDIGWRKRPILGALVLVLAVNVTACGFAARPLVKALQRTLGVDRTAATLIAVVPMFLLPPAAASIVFWYLLRKPMREALGEMGHEVCINCGHLLRGLDDGSANCPECGHLRESMPRADRSESPP